MGFELESDKHPLRKSQTATTTALD